MTTLLAALDFNNLVIGAAIGAVIGFFSVGTGRGTVAVNVKRLELQLSDLQKKLDALLKHQGVEMPTPHAVRLVAGASVDGQRPAPEDCRHQTLPGRESRNRLVRGEAKNRGV
jgi:hypothetical protein